MATYRTYRVRLLDPENCVVTVHADDCAYEEQGEFIWLNFTNEDEATVAAFPANNVLGVAETWPGEPA